MAELPTDGGGEEREEEKEEEPEEKEEEKDVDSEVKDEIDSVVNSPLPGMCKWQLGPYIFGRWHKICYLGCLPKHIPSYC